MCKNRDEEFTESHVVLLLAVQCLHEGSQMLLLWMQIGSAAEAVPWYHCEVLLLLPPAVQIQLFHIPGGRGAGLLSQTEKRSSLSNSCPYSDCHWPWFLLSVNEDWRVFSLGQGLIFIAVCAIPVLSLVQHSGLSCIYMASLVSFYCLIKWKLPEVHLVLCEIWLVWCS